MGNTIYHINKGINKGLEFKGLRAQYIWYLGGGLVGILVLFAILYICGLNPYVCVGITLVIGGGLFAYVYKLNNKYGEHGLMQKGAQKKVPPVIHCHSRKTLCKRF